MRSQQLLGIAMQAEKIRLHRYASSLVQRIVFTLAGAVFVVCALVFGEYAGYSELRTAMQPPVASLVAAACNLAVAVLFLVLAARHRRDRLATEAKLVRDNAISELKSGFTAGMLVRRMAASAGLGSMSSMALAGFAAKFLRRFFVVTIVIAGMVASQPRLAKAADDGRHAAQIVSPANPPVPAVAPPTNQSPRATHGKTTLPEKLVPHSPSTVPEAIEPAAPAGH